MISTDWSFSQVWTLLLLSYNVLINGVHYAMALTVPPLRCPKFSSFIQKKGENG